MSLSESIILENEKVRPRGREEGETNVEVEQQIKHAQKQHMEISTAISVTIRKNVRSESNLPINRLMYTVKKTLMHSHAHNKLILP